MDRSTPSNIIEASSQPTVASVLGVTGAFRFHPHGSTQKAHVVLRQVELPEDSDEETDPSTLYFSLFAQKRIEVKPGKEILLAVAAPDGRFLDTPVILAAKMANSSSPPEANGVSASNQRGVISAAKESAMPPKMRKTWSSRFEATQSTVSSSHSYVSVSVQTEPASADKADHVEVNVDDVTDDTRPSTQDSKVSSRRDKSLSPMDLDSPDSSPALSPVTPSMLPLAKRLKSSSFSPPGLWISTSPQHPPVEAEAEIAPLHLSPDNGDPPGLSMFPPPEQPQAVPQAGQISSETKQPEKVGTPTSTISDASRTVVASPPLKQLVASVEISTNLPPMPEAPVSATPYIPKRKIVPNPFVSGGLLTDFVGTSSSLKAQEANSPQASVQSSGDGHDAKNSSKSLSPPPGLNSTAQSVSVETAKDTPLTPLSSSPASPISPHTPVRSKSPSSSPSASASSSKVKVEDVPLAASESPVPPIRTSTPSRSPQVPLLTNMFVPASTNRPPAQQSDTRRQWSRFSKTITPPPDPRELAYVPTSSYSNPLNIKPSGGYGWRGDRPHPPNLPVIQPNPSRKPVAIGAGWPHNRQANGNNGRRSSFKRAPNGSAGPQLPSQTGAYTQSQSMVPSVSPMSAGSDKVADPRLAASTAEVQQPESDGAPPGTWNKPDGPQTPPRPANAEHEKNTIGYETRSPTTPLSARSPITLRTDTASGAHPQPLSSQPAQSPAFSVPPADEEYSPRQSLKRVGSPVPQAQTPVVRRARTFKWPTAEGVYAVRVKGDGDVGIRSIEHNSDGTMLAVICYDKSVRIWNNKSHTEFAKLAHNMQVTAVAWMDRDAGVITLGDNGMVSTWTRSAGNKWQWAKILDASDRKVDDSGPCCLAFWRDRIAIGYPKSGVKVWLFIKGTWLPQRSILRQNVTVIKFVEDGNALLGGTTDGVLWYCEVPNGTLRAYAFMKTRISSLDVDPKGTHALAAQSGGRAHLVNISQDDLKGKVQQVYATSDLELQGGISYDYGALFANGGSSLLFGCVRGCILVWDRNSGEIVYGLQHGEDTPVQAVTCFDRNHATEGHILTGTRHGLLTWFSQPPA